MKKKYLKILSAIMLFLAILTTVYSSYAFEITTSNYKPIVSATPPEIAQKIFRAVQLIGVGLAVIFLVIIGIKYIIGSVDERARYKETMVSYIWGLILVVGTATVLKYLVSVINGFGL